MAAVRRAASDFGDEPGGGETLGPLRDWKRDGDIERLAAAALDKSAGPGWRWFAARYLGAFSDPLSVDALTDLLADEDRRLRQRAARSLQQIGAPARAAVPALRAALFDGEGHVRICATRALGAIGDKSAVPDLVRVAETTGWDALHSWATGSLVLLGAPEAAAHLVRRLDSPKTWQRRWAARQLGPIGTESAVAPLRDARKRDPLHRWAYTRAIRQIERRTSRKHT